MQVFVGLNPNGNKIMSVKDGNILTVSNDMREAKKHLSESMYFDDTIMFLTDVTRFSINGQVILLEPLPKYMQRFIVSKNPFEQAEERIKKRNSSF